MTFTEPTFEVDLDAEGFQPTTAERQLIETEVDRLAPLVAEFPTQILHVNVRYNQNSESYEVKLALVLPGQTFATGNVSESWHGSLETSVQKMVRRIEHYKSVLERDPQHARAVAGTTTEVEPNRQIDGLAVQAAIEAGSYNDFRQLMFPLEESLRDRIGRWIQRYPQIQSMLGERFTIADVMEETFLMAFDNHDQWHPEMFYGQWIESLIDPALKAIAQDPEGELESISFLQSWNETE